MGKAGGVGLLIMCAIPGAYNISPIVGFQMFKSANQDLERFAKQIPKNAVVIYHDYTEDNPAVLELVATPLRFLFQRSILPVQDDEIPASAIDWLKRNFPGRTILAGTLGGCDLHLSWPYTLSPQPVAKVPIDWSTFAAKEDALPRTRGRLQGDLELWQVRMSDDQKPFRATASNLRRVGIRFDGLYGVELNASRQPFRWTNGKAELQIPAERVRDSQMLYVVLADNRPRTAETEIVLNSHRLGAVRVYPGQVMTFPFRLPDNWLEESTNLRLEVRTPTWVPAQVSDSRDTRKLGVMLLEVRFAK
jgi:hypothetical protein